MVPTGALVPEHPSPVVGDPRTSSSGLSSWILVKGEGARPKRGQQVEVEYVGWRSDGRRFDSGFGPGHRFSFILGYGQVIRAWDEVVAEMRVGEQRQLRVPPSLGFGKRSDFEEGEFLVYELRLLSVR